MKVLVTGGAGFIGSNLVRCLIASGHDVRVLDDLSTGNRANLSGLDDSIELVVGDLRRDSFLSRATKGVEVVYHLAALPSVARSVADPLSSHEINATGTLRVLTAAREAGARCVVYASSSSAYGNTPALPKVEAMPTQPRSPYAVSKLTGENYCRAFSSVYDLKTVSLRFFNVFGPRQDPASEYAAVIPRFITRMLDGEPPQIQGDGRQTRDFTYVGNVVQGLLLAAESDERANGEVFNLGYGGRINLLDLVGSLNDLLGTQLAPEFTTPRPGDVRDSQASIENATEILGYRPLIDLKEGLQATVRWFDSLRAVA